MKALNRTLILEIAAKHGAHNVRVFGSVARGEDRPDSDLDLLVDFEPDRSLMDHSLLILDLHDALGQKVDVIIERGLHWFIRDQVLKDAVAL